MTRSEARQGSTSTTRTGTCSSCSSLQLPDPQMSITQPSAAVGSVASADGTTIGYRRVGDGPGVVLVHGAGQSSQNLMTLARSLSDRFTVYVPDRSGRGMSGPGGRATATARRQ